MPIDAINRLRQTVLFQRLLERESETENSHEISERVAAVVEQLAPLLERVPEKMPEFTLHDPNHSAKIVELMAQLIPSETIERLNVIELSILIYSAYLHDIGMTCSSDERDKIIDTDSEYAKLLAADEVRADKLERFRAEGAHRAATAVEDQIFTEYLRRAHVRRSARYIEENFSSGHAMIGWQGTPYFRWVQAVCDSHALPVDRLRDTKMWPRDALVRNLRVNVQYLSLVLRLADILDLDPERTPKVLLDFINPKDATSITEWHKHRSVIGWEITPERIRFEAECSNPIYQRTLLEFLDWIEIERRDSVLLASSYRDELSRVYKLDLTEPVSKEGVRSNGKYIYSDLKFNIDYRSVLTLLMGERLYGNSIIALRELLQNSVDAVRYREALEDQSGTSFTPQIAIRFDGSKLIVEDNGVGMDEHIFKNYFIQVGRSYYRSAEFRASNVNLDPISEFGIGILSVFMVADHCEVESRRFPLDPLHPPVPISIQIPTAYDYFVQQHSHRTKIGTSITLFLKPNHPFSSENLPEIVARLAPFIEYPISIHTPEGTYEYQPRSVGNPIEADDVETILKITFEDSNDPILAGVKGNLYIAKNRPGSNSAYGQFGLVAHRGFTIARLSTDDSESFSIEYESTIKQLFPRWTTTNASIDLRGQSRLTLTPDRGDAVIDDHFVRLRSAIEDRVIEAFRKHLEEYRSSNSTNKYDTYIGNLLANRCLGVDRNKELKEDLKNLILNLVPLPCVLPDGELSRCFGNELDGVEAFAVTSQADWPADMSGLKIREATHSDIGTMPLLLKAEPGLSARSMSLTEIFGNPTGHLITSIAGVVFELTSSAPTSLQDFMFQGSMFTRGLQSSYSEFLPVLLYPTSPAHTRTPLYNALHPLIALFLSDEGPKDERCEELLESLDTRIADIFEDLEDRRLLSLVTHKRRYIGYGDAVNLALVGVLKREPALLDSIREAFDDLWREARKAGVIKADSAFPGVTANDLPWFWSHQD